jgi:hypothetical protein
MSVHPAMAVVCHGQGLRKPFGLVIDGAQANRIYISPICLRLRVLERVSVAFGSGSVQKASAIFVRDLERGFGSGRTCAQRFDRQAQVFRRAGWRCKIENIVHAPGIERIADVPFFESEARLVSQMGQVFKITRRKVVHAENGVALVEQPIG